MDFARGKIPCKTGRGTLYWKKTAGRAAQWHIRRLGIPYERRIRRRRAREIWFRSCAAGHKGNALGIFLAIAVAGVVYLVLVVAIRAISKDDLALMPKGDKLARLLRL